MTTYCTEISEDSVTSGVVITTAAAATTSTASATTDNSSTNNSSNFGNSGMKIPIPIRVSNSSYQYDNPAVLKKSNHIFLNNI